MPAPQHVPTPDEIAERAAEVRAGSSDEDHYRRLRPDWRPRPARLSRLVLSAPLPPPPAMDYDPPAD